MQELSAYNTRLFKHTEGDKVAYEVRLASAQGSTPEQGVTYMTNDLDTRHTEQCVSFHYSYVLLDFQNKIHLVLILSFGMLK